MGQQQSKAHKGRVSVHCDISNQSEPASHQPANQPATGQPGSEDNTGSWADDLEAQTKKPT